jgi:hypothetical protein
MNARTMELYFGSKNVSKVPLLSQDVKLFTTFAVKEERLT